jgi:hypothetical protein
MRSTSVTIPVAINVAHTLMASAASSGEESAAKAGVSAEPICAWYCSSNVTSAKSGSGVLPKSYGMSASPPFFAASLSYLENLIDDLQSAYPQLNHTGSRCRKSYADHVRDSVL